MNYAVNLPHELLRAGVSVLIIVFFIILGEASTKLW